MNHSAEAQRPTADESGPLMLVADLRRLLLSMRRYWYLVAASIFACLALAVIYLATAKKVYQATTRIMVFEGGGKPLGAAGDQTHVPEEADDLLSTHAAVLSSPLIVGRAVASMGANLEQASADANNNMVDAAIGNMSVSRPDRLARILRIDYRANSREEAVRFLDAVLISYREFLLKDLIESSNSSIIQLIEGAKGQLEKELAVLERSYVEFRRKHPDVTAAKKGKSFNERRVEQWGLAAAEVMIKAVQVKAKLQMGRKLADAGAEFWAVAHAMSELGSASSGLLSAVDPRTAQGGSAEYIRQLTQEQQRLSEEFGPGYSKVAEIRDRIAKAQDRMKGKGGRIDQAETRDLIRSTEQAFETLESMQVDYKKRFEDDLKKSNEEEVVLLDDENLRNNLERHRTLFNAVMDQLKRAQLAGDYSSIKTQTIEPPRAAAKPVKPAASLTLALAGMAGCLLGLATALVADHFHSRFHSPEDLRRTLGARVFGAIPRFPELIAGSPKEAGRISHKLPLSRWSECYRSIRTNLELARRHHPIRVILVTSPKPEDGKSVTASNLAISFAQAGRTVLLVDADLRRPLLHQIFEVDEAQGGLVGMLRDGADLTSAIVRTGIPHLDILPAGPSPSNPAELLSSNHWGLLIYKAREAYDTVIVDSPPLLSVVDASILGATADCLILVVRATETSRQDVASTGEILEILGTPVLGTVFNAVAPKHRWAGYGYGYESIYGDAGDNSTDSYGSQNSQVFEALNGHAELYPIS